ncbi:MAG: ubiquinone/menaquinone biosynthesis methyltransferase [Acidobacteria bacterium]|nr:ubiquinone/menaquinone biosynthesis methyltransferase [Acidobacteriota bacterium]
MHEALLEKRASEIQGMFARIAHRYDLLNRVLSLGRDVAWRRAIARRVAKIDPRRALDMCTGTGDVALALPAAVPTLASDFCVPMLMRAADKARRRGRHLALFAADAARLPLADGSVEAVTVAFGVRNFERLEAGLAELIRVLGVGGKLVILEFSHPRGPLAPILGWWSRAVPPLVGRWLSGDGEAYDYLPASVATFPDRDGLCRVLEDLGLTAVAGTPLTGGVVTLYEGTKKAAVGGVEGGA